MATRFDGKSLIIYLPTAPARPRILHVFLFIISSFYFIHFFGLSSAFCLDCHGWMTRGFQRRFFFHRFTTLRDIKYSSRLTLNSFLWICHNLLLELTHGFVEIRRTRATRFVCIYHKYMGFSEHPETVSREIGIRDPPDCGIYLVPVVYHCQLCLSSAPVCNPFNFIFLRGRWFAENSEYCKKKKNRKERIWKKCLFTGRFKKCDVFRVVEFD